MKRAGSFCFLFVFVTTLFIIGCQESKAKKTADAPALKEQKQTAETAAAAPTPTPAGTEAKPASKTESKSAEAVKGPRILVTKAFHDFGNVGPGSNNVCEFTFQNAGTETLKIEQVQSTCGCSVPQLKKNDYEPGETGTVEVRFHAPTSKGETKKQLYIISNDPSNSRAQLELRAMVLVNVEADPTEISLMLNKPNAGLVPITIKSLDNRQFSITKFVATNDVITCAIDPAKKATEFVLEPVADMTKLAQFLNGVISIEVDHPQGGTILVRYNTLPQYEINRPRIILQNVKPGQVEKKEVLITAHYGDTLKIKSSSSRMGMMKIVGQQITENTLTLTIEISVPQQESAGKRYISDELTITFENDQQTIIRTSGWFKN
jgi:hypothetical protein